MKLSTKPLNTHLLFLSGMVFLLLLGYAGLLGTSTWRQDEYYTLARYQTEGTHFLWHRIIAWSPRPFSELLIYLYAQLVNTTKLQLTPLMMGLVWFGLFFSIGMGVHITQNTRISIGTRVLPVVLPVILTLSISKTGEVFYWSFGSVAYMPTISAILLMLAILIWGNIQEHALPWGISASVLATSSEMGAFFVVALFTLLTLSGISRHKTIVHPDYEWTWLKPLAPSTLMAIAVLALLSFGRLGNSDEAKMGSEVSHNIAAALATGIPETARQILGKSETDWLELAPYFSIKILLGLFIFYLLRFSPIDPRKRSMVISFSLASIASIGLSEIGALYQFGVSCCERHDTTRHFLSYIGVISFSAGISSLMHGQKIKKSATLICMGSGYILVALCTLLSAKKLWLDYENQKSIINLHHENWIFHQTPPFTFTIDSNSGYTYGTLPMPTEGTYIANHPNTPTFNESILRFFDANEIVFGKNIKNSDTIDQNLMKSLHTISDWCEAICMTDAIQLDNRHAGKKEIESALLTIRGWINLPDTGLDTSKIRVFLIIRQDTHESEFYVPLELFDRPDVARHFNRNELLRSGYAIIAKIPSTPIRDLSIIATDGALSARCPLPLP